MTTVKKKQEITIKLRSNALLPIRNEDAQFVSNSFHHDMSGNNNFSDKHIQL